MKHIQYILLLISLMVFCLPVYAESTAIVTYENGTVMPDVPSYVITPPVQHPPYPPYRLPAQGAAVYKNDTVDISGQGWGEGVAWYGHWGEYDEPQYIRMFSDNYNKKDLQNFYLDPVIFDGRWGMWYQYYGNDTERNGNLAAFFVKDGYRNTTDGINTTADEKEFVPLVKVQQSVLPEVHVSDYLVAHGDPLPTNISRLWIFGRVDGVYGVPGDLSVNQILDLEDGSYKFVSQESGVNTIFDVGYNKEKDSLWKNSYDAMNGASLSLEYIGDLQPMLILDKFYQTVSSTDDKIQTLNIEIEEPDVTILSIDEVDVGNRMPVKYEPGMTLLDVRGYSNVKAETTITFVLDADQQTVRSLKDNSWTTTLTRSSPGNKSMYQLYIPVNKNRMTNDIHTISVSTPIGGSMTYNLPISELPADSYVEPAKIKYIGNQNPFVPTPTPITIIERPAPIIQQVVVTQQIPVPPSQESVDAAQREAIIGIMSYAIVLFGIVLCAVYLVSAIVRRRKI